MGADHTGEQYEPLTNEQELVSRKRAETKQLVTASAGTGKTYTLIYRAKKLIDSDDIHAGGQILILSFSRAAVREIRRRVRTMGGDLAYLRARTFDSFATMLLATIQPDGDWRSKDYDGRIVNATALIRDNNEAKQFIASFHHVIVDEVQDLVGVRAALVAIVLENAKGGFTLFGDPAQGIYNFQVEGEERRLGSAVLYGWLRKRFATALDEETLGQNFRAHSTVSRTALWAGEKLNSPLPDYTSILQRLLIVKTALPAVPGVNALVQGLAAKYEGSTAVLCRTNGEALYISGLLWRARIMHRLQAAAVERTVAPWLALCARAMTSRVVGRAQFLSCYPVAAGVFVSAEEAWKMLRRIDRSSQQIDFARVADRVRVGDVPDDVSFAPECSIVVSTIHRAKGLEFDRVFVLYEPPPRDYEQEEDAEQDDAERARLLYVALTRSRKDLLRIPPLEGVFLAFNRWAERWRVPVRGSRGMTSHLEIKGRDARADLPPGLGTDLTGQIQDYIWSNVKPGDPITLAREAIREGDTLKTQYKMVHDHTVVGAVTGDGVFQVLKVNRWWHVVMPIRITDIYVENVDSVSGMQGAAQASGLGFADMWLRVRVSGLGKAEYSQQELDHVRREQ